MLKRLASLTIGCCLAGQIHAVESIGGTEPPRAARSVHLSWPAAEGEAFYIEMAVEKSTAGSYFMAAGWSGGYFGVQELSGGRKVAIFSVWDPTKGDDANSVKLEDRVELLHEGEGVRIKRFGGEGTGGQCMMDFPWELEQTNRFLVRATVQENKTAYAGYLFLPDKQEWKHLVTFRTRTGGKPLRGLYSFVEDFRRDGKSVGDIRQARFGNGWAINLQGEWQPLKQARFTASGASWEARDNINGGLAERGFFLATGGETKRTLDLSATVKTEAFASKVPSDLPLGELTTTTSGAPESVTVFEQGKDGWPDYRIPSIVVTKRGTLLAFAEARQTLRDNAQNDIVLKRSTDGGRTWLPIQLVAEDGENNLNNPNAVVVRETGRVLLMYQRFPKGFHEAEVVPGYDDPRICRSFMVHSDDDGLTWSAPVELTRSVKRPIDVTSVASGPGVGIQLTRGAHKGRLVMPFNEGPFEKWKVYAAYSDDQGKTWRYGDIAPEESPGAGNEVQMVELSDGSVLLNSRSYKGNRHRKTAISRDGGQTWSGLVDDPTLVEPECQGSILRYTWADEDGKSRLLFLNPASTKGRSNGALRLSYDEGKTWPVEKTIHPTGFAYSCLAVMADKSIGCLFEADGYKKIKFARVSLDWLTDGKDRLTPAP